MKSHILAVLFFIVFGVNGYSLTGNLGYPGYGYANGFGLGGGYGGFGGYPGYPGYPGYNGYPGIGGVYGNWGAPGWNYPGYRPGLYRPGIGIGIRPSYDPYLSGLGGFGGFGGVGLGGLNGLGGGSWDGSNGLYSATRGSPSYEASADSQNLLHSFAKRSSQQ